jgi:hypothetical protein
MRASLASAAEVSAGPCRLEGGCLGACVLLCMCLAISNISLDSVKPYRCRFCLPLEIGSWRSRMQWSEMVHSCSVQALHGRFQHAQHEQQLHGQHGKKGHFKLPTPTFHDVSIFASDLGSIKSWVLSTRIRLFLILLLHLPLSIHTRIRFSSPGHSHPILQR